MKTNSDGDSNSGASQRRWYHFIGPGLITACVVIGPGSILTSSNVGAKNGYGLSWVVIVAVFFMLVFMSMGARLGVAVQQSPGAVIAQRIGRWFAVLLGLGVFFISAAFQFGNNLGVHFALANYVDFDWMIVIFNALAIAFLLVFKNMYKALEKLMMLFVGVMLLAFFCNLIMAKPRLGEWALGLVPGGSAKFDVSVLALVGTTFVTSAAFFQTYLVRQKGWSSSQLRQGIVDVRVGAAIMMVITLMLMATPATVFYPDFRHEQVVVDAGASGLEKNRTLIIADDDQARFEQLKLKAEAEIDWKEKKTNQKRWAAVIAQSEFVAKYGSLKQPPRIAARGFRDLPEVGTSLRPLFGAIGPPLFFLGVFAAAYSSFLVNSMIGGFILADGLGIGDRATDRWPKIFTIAVLLTGMCVGLYCIIGLKGQSPVGLIVAAQAVTVLASPLVAGTLLWLTSNKDLMGKHVNGTFSLVAGTLGLILLIAMSVNLAFTKVIPAIVGLFAAGS